MKIFQALWTFGLCSTGREARLLLEKSMVFLNGIPSSKQDEVGPGDTIHVVKNGRIVADAVVTDPVKKTGSNKLIVLRDGESSVLTLSVKINKNPFN